MLLVGLFKGGACRFPGRTPRHIRTDQGRLSISLIEANRVIEGKSKDRGLQSDISSTRENTHTHTSCFRLAFWVCLSSRQAQPLHAAVCNVRRSRPHTDLSIGDVEMPAPGEQERCLLVAEHQLADVD
eukprot:1160512-Pelagomonas_calceolata.AAC.13